MRLELFSQVSKVIVYGYTRARPCHGLVAGMTTDQT